MRFAFICNGSHGDVQPYVALAKGLQQAGHEARVVGPENYARFVSSHEVAFSPLSGDVQAFLKSAEFAAVAAKGFLAVQRMAVRKASELVTRWLAEAAQACEGSDTIVAGIGGHSIAEAVAEKLSAKFVQAHVQPLTTTSTFPGALAPAWFPRLGGWGHRLGHMLTRQVMWQPMRPALNHARRTVLGLPKATFWGRLGKTNGSGLPILYGYSRHVLPRPPDWDDAVKVTGYWFLDGPQTWQPPTELSNFLASGPPPIVVGFGSMMDKDAEATTRLVVASVRKLNARAILIAGWAGLNAADLGNSICVVESAPHDWLYPQAALVVHHGGAGTTGAMFRAGVPGVIVPFTAEQPFWGRRVAALGCGPDPIPRWQLTANKLATAIEFGLRDEVKRRAKELGELVRAENGVQEAVGYLTA